MPSPLSRSPQHFAHRGTGFPARGFAPRALHSSPFSLESLEPRALLYSWTAQEVYFSELINRARANPTAEADRLGLNFSTGLSAAEQALLIPREPLALSATLTASARLHSADMAARGFFDHANPDGRSPTDRALQAGYSGTAGENIGAGYATIDALYSNWLATPDERRNALSLYTSFDSTFHYDHLGPGFALNVTGALYPSYYTADFGNPSTQTRAPWLLGVVFSDTSGDNFYSTGEGAASIRVDAFPGSTTTGTPAATYTTDAAGNYQLPLTNGSYSVVFTRTSDNFRVVKAATISGQNVRLTTTSAELRAPPPPPDDFADAGQWSGAGNITINPATGGGSIAGTLGVSGDTDLFVFIAARTGITHISGLPANAAYDGRIRVYNSAQSLVATGIDGANPAHSVADVSLVAGSTYYIIFSATNSASTGGYSVTIEAPPLPPPPPPPTDDFANAGDWAGAGAIDINGTSGSGTRSGSLEVGGDSDLFTFTASQTGSSILTAASSGLAARLRVYDTFHNLLATGSPGTLPPSSIATLNLTAGQVYFLLIDSTDAAQTGTYAAIVQGPIAPPPPVDDFANATDWAHAATIALDAATGNGSRAGSIEVPTDSDLFTFIAVKGGLTSLAALSNSGGLLATRIRIYDAASTLIATGTPGTNPLDSVLSATLTAGARYYVVVDSEGGATAGAYTVQLLAPTIPQQNLGIGGQPVNTLWLAGRPVLSFVNELGRPIVAIRSPQSAWTSTDLQQAASSPAIAGDLQTWIDARDGLLYAAARSNSGVLVFKRAASGGWSYRNLTTEIAVSRNIVSNLTTFTDSGGLRQIGGIDSNGHVVSYWMTGLMWPRGWRYFYTDLATRDLVRRNHAMPVVSAGGPITSYVTHKNSLNIIASNPAGHVILFYRPGGGLATQLWNWIDLSTLTGAAPLVGAITAAQTTGRVVNISGTDAAGNLWMVTWRTGDGWRSRNVTSSVSGSVPLTPGSITSWVNSTGAGFVAGLTTAGDIVLYRYTFTNNQNTWNFATISAAVVNAPRPVDSLRATITSTGAILISGVTRAGEVVRFTFDTSWSAESISQLL